MLLAGQSGGIFTGIARSYHCFSLREARSDVLAHAPAIPDRCPALLSYVYNRVPFSLYAQQNTRWNIGRMAGNYVL
jgi:hypothetical protein